MPVIAYGRLALLLLAFSAHGRRLQKNSSSSELELSDPEKSDFAKMFPKFAEFWGGLAPAKPSQREMAAPSSVSSCARGDEKFDYFTGCKQVQANGLTFDCRFGPGTKGKVMLLHGFPYWSATYVSLMEALSQAGYESVACNQRGYSPGASPDDESEYNYHLLRDDVFAVASAVGFQKFHLVAHDHGAVLGWWTAGSKIGSERILSISALAIPHTDAFSAGLFGPTADLQQQMASQYFSMFVLPNSSSIRAYFFYNLLGRLRGFNTSWQFQKALWWYNGAMAAGVLSAPPVMDAVELSYNGNHMMSVMRSIFWPLRPEGLPKEGRAATSPSGRITMPAMYVCGSDDGAILCNRPFAMETEKYCSPGKYRYLEVKCGHDPLACKDEGETKKVIEGIVDFIGEQEQEKTMDPPICCKAMTASCLACAQGQTIEDYCQMNPQTQGCGTLMPQNLLPDKVASLNMGS